MLFTIEFVGLGNPFAMGYFNQKEMWGLTHLFGEIDFNLQKSASR